MSQPSFRWVFKGYEGRSYSPEPSPLDPDAVSAFWDELQQLVGQHGTHTAHILWDPEDRRPATVYVGENDEELGWSGTVQAAKTKADKWLRHQYKPPRKRSKPATRSRNLTQWRAHIVASLQSAVDRHDALYEDEGGESDLEKSIDAETLCGRAQQAFRREKESFRHLRGSVAGPVAAAQVRSTLQSLLKGTSDSIFDQPDFARGLVTPLLAEVDRAYPPKQP